VLNARVVRPIRLRPSSEQLEPSKPVKMHSDNTLIIHYNGKSGKRSLLKAVKRYGAKVIYDYKNFSSIAVKLPEGKNVDDAKAYFEKVKGVKQVNYDRIMQLM
jgi:hypothetical protein